MITLAIHCVGFYVLRIQWCYNCPIVASSPWQTAGLALAGEGMLTRAGQARKSAGECEFVAKGIAVQPGLHIAGRADAIAGQQAACIDLTREDPCPSDMILMDVPCTPGTQGLLLHCPSWYTIDLQNITGLHRGAAGYGKVPGVETCPQTGWQPAVSLHHEGWEYTQGQLERLQEMVDQSAAPGMRSPTGISLRHVSYTRLPPHRRGLYFLLGRTPWLFRHDYVPPGAAYAEKCCMERWTDLCDVQDFATISHRDSIYYEKTQDEDPYPAGLYRLSVLARHLAPC